MVGSRPPVLENATPKAPAATLKLRLLGGAHDGRVVELAARKCTLGASPQCTLRLRAAGIEPVHCLIDRSGPRTIVLRQSGTLWLNGERLERAWLEIGDRLRLGPLELEVLADARACPPSLPPSPDTAAHHDLDARFQQLEDKLTALQQTPTELLRPEPPQPPADDARRQADRHAELEQLKVQVSADVAAKVADDLALRLKHDLAQQVTGEVTTQVTANIMHQVATEVTPRMAANLAQHLDCSIAARVATEVTDQITAQVNGRLTAEIAMCTAAEVTRTTDSLAARVTNDVTARVAADLAPIVTAHVTSEVAGQVSQRLSAQIETVQKAWDEDRLAWQQEQQQTRSDLAEYTTLLDRRLESLVRLEQELQVERQHWNEQQPAASTLSPAPDEEIQRCLSTVQQLQLDAAAERDAVRHELQLLRDEIVDHADKLAHQLIKLEAKWEAFQHEQRQRQAVHDETSAAAEARADQIDHRLAEIRAEREAFEHDRHHPPAERTHVHPGEHVKQIDDRLAQIQHRREAAERDRYHLWQDDVPPHDVAHPGESAHAAPTPSDSHDSLPELAPAETEDAPAAETNDEPQPEGERRGVSPTWGNAGVEPSDVPEADAGEPAELPLVEDAPQPEVAFEPVGGRSPASALEMFSGLVQKIETEDERPRAQGDEVPQEDVCGAFAVGEHFSEDGSPTVGKKAEAEESIDDYMARLMQRVKTIAPTAGAGTANPPAESSSAPPISAPRETPVRRPSTPVQEEPAAAEEEPAERKIVDLSELNPRVVPPELTSNISAMRDLANLSARSALDAHSRKRLSATTYSKLSVAIAALLAAVALTWFARNGDPVTFAAALVSTVVAVVWGLEYLILSGNWHGRRKLGPNDAKPPK